MPSLGEKEAKQEERSRGVDKKKEEMENKLAYTWKNIREKWQEEKYREKTEEGKRRNVLVVQSGLMQQKF